MYDQLWNENCSEPFERCSKPRVYTEYQAELLQKDRHSAQIIELHEMSPMYDSNNIVPKLKTFDRYPHVYVLELNRIMLQFHRCSSAHQKSSKGKYSQVFVLSETIVHLDLQMS